MEFLADIIQSEIVDKINNEIVISSINPPNILKTTNTSYATTDTAVLDGGGFNYAIKQVVKDDYIKVNAPSFSPNLFLPIPTFKWGTQRATNNEYVNAGVRPPLIWLLDPWAETHYQEKNEKERTADCVIFFLDNYIPNETNEDNKERSMIAMFNLAKLFVQAIDKNKKYFNEASSVVYMPRTRFGTETAQGSESSILDDNLCGCELRITFDINKVSKQC